MAGCPPALGLLGCWLDGQGFKPARIRMDPGRRPPSPSRQPHGLDSFHSHGHGHGQQQPTIPRAGRGTPAPPYTAPSSNYSTGTQHATSLVGPRRTSDAFVRNSRPWEQASHLATPPAAAVPVRTVGGASSDRRVGGNPAPTASPAAGRSKRVRTGCLTCRERHLKCDEGGPDCNNCRKSNRECRRGVRLNFIELRVKEPPCVVQPTSEWSCSFSLFLPLSPSPPLPTIASWPMSSFVARRRHGHADLSSLQFKSWMSRGTSPRSTREDSVATRKFFRRRQYRIRTCHPARRLNEVIPRRPLPISLPKSTVGELGREFETCIIRTTLESPLPTDRWLTMRGCEPTRALITHYAALCLRHYHHGA